MGKQYPFSVQKHGHDIEYFANHVYVTMREMEDGETPMNKRLYDWLVDMHENKLRDLRCAIMDTSDGRVAWLTGQQLMLANRAVAWAGEARARKAGLRQVSKTF